MKTGVTLLVLLIACFSCSEPGEQQHESEIDDLVSSFAHINAGDPGTTIAVAQGDQILFSKGYGSANPEYDIPNTKETIFHVASVSKQFTAFAIAILHDQGKLSLEDDVRKHIPELPDFGPKITIKHLVHHTSGLRDQWNLLALAGWRLDDVITRDQIIRLISHQKELNFSPGNQFSYCNTGYTLMAEIVSRVTGQSFPDWCEENIFEPLNMRETLFYDDHEKLVKNRAYSFYKSDNGFKKSVLSYANAGATSLFTTAEDLVKWSDNFYQMTVGNERIMRLMDERGVLNGGDTLSYAFGQGISTYNGLRTISHDGADAGYRSVLIRFPDQKYTVAVLANAATFDPRKLALGIADLFLKDFMKDEAETQKTTIVSSAPVGPELLKRYEGQYEMDGQVFTVKARDGKLIIQPSGGPEFALQTKSDSSFFLDEFGLTFVFNDEGDTLINQFTMHQAGTALTGKRVKPFDPRSIKDLTEYAGRYYSAELETSYTLKVENDTLVAHHIRHDPAKLTPSAANTFGTPVWFMSKIEFVPDKNGKIEGFKVSSGRVRNVWFARRD